MSLADGRNVINLVDFPINNAPAINWIAPDKKILFQNGETLASAKIDSGNLVLKGTSGSTWSQRTLDLNLLNKFNYSPSNPTAASLFRFKQWVLLRFVFVQHLQSPEGPLIDDL